MGPSWRFLALLAAMSVIVVTATAAKPRREVPMPPQMIRQPLFDEILFQVAVGMDEKDKPFILDCEATGTQPLKYRWYKSGRTFDFQAYDNRISQQPGRGTLVVTKPTDVDEGYYNCTATNELGTSVSNSAMVRKADLGVFPDEPVREVVVKEGDPLSLRCSPPTGYPKPNIFWMIQNKAVGALKTINSSRITVDPEGTLHFSNVTAFDSHDDAYYACSAINMFRNEYKLGNRVKLTVLASSTGQAVQSRHPPSEQYRSPPNIISRRGEPQEIHCIFGGTPLPEIRWRRKNGLLNPSRYTTINYGKTLKLKKVDFEDTGTYECMASNGVGHAESHAVAISVQSKPYWVIAPNSTNAAEEEDVRFECKASGVPEPDVRWFVNGIPVDKAPPNPRRRLVTPTVMSITHLEKTDTAVFQCNASNTLGYAFRDFYLNVLALEPTITEPPAKVYEAVDGQTIDLRCRVFGAPQPQVSWLRSGKELTGGRYTTQDNGDLQIEGVQFTDAGRYKCIARNKLGNDSSDDSLGLLEVKMRTKITALPVDYEVRADDTAIFRCNAVGDSSLELEIEWLSSGQLIDFDEDPRMYKGPDSALVITKTRELDSGIYTCIAKTRLDNITSSATLTVQDVPNAPRMVGVKCMQKTARVEWQPMGDNRAPILSFIIQYNTSFTPDIWSEAFNEVPAASLIFEVFMSPWANYSFRVIAENKIGPSLPSGHSSTCQTPPSVPDKNPEKVQGQGDRPDNLVISWTQMPLIEHNGPGFFYRVFWKRKNMGTDWITQDIYDWQQTRLVVTNSPTFVSYTIKVEAHNLQGQANLAATEVTGYSGENVPLEPPRNLTLLKIVDANTAELSWRPVPPDSLRGHFKGYKIQTWTMKETFQRNREMVVLSNQTQTEVNLFVPFSENFVRVLTFNGQYDGPPSEVLRFRAPEGKPGPVAQLEAYPMGSSGLRLVWKEPLEKNGILTGYRIYHDEVTGTALGPRVERDPPVNDSWATEANLLGLKPNTKYRVTIMATTSKGPGVPYFIETVTKNTSSAPPDTPTFSWWTEAVQNERAAITVKWKPNLNGNPGSHFFVQYKKKDETTFMATSHIYYKDVALITGLDPSSVYQVRVVAVDGEYTSASAIEEVMTSGAEAVYISNSPYTVASAAWFIGMMVAIFLLLIILIIVCLVKRNRGGKYSVHEKEIARGKGLDYPDDGSGFHEYSKPPGDKNNVKGSKTSLNSGVRPGESDTDSMAEYGDGETGKFTEDGSFIGQYGSTKKKFDHDETSPTAHATFV